MKEAIRVQGRNLFPADINYIKQEIANHPDRHRTRLSQELCAAWNWMDEVGRPKDMACRTMLLKLECRGLLALSLRKRSSTNHLRGKFFQPILHDTSALSGALRSIQPISLVCVDRRDEVLLWQTLLTQYHYLGFTTRVGQSLSYMAYTCDGRPLACLLFGAAAWKTAARDEFIGWNTKARERNISRVVNNMRFLIPLWVNVPHLASHVLGMALRQLPGDWLIKYGFEPVLIETFVEKKCFKGTCHKAANNPAHPKKRYADEKFTPESIRKDKFIPYRSGKFFIGGKYCKIRYKEIRNVLWQRGAGEKRLRLIVLAPIPYHLSPNSRANYRDPVYLLTDANDMNIHKLIQAYVDRWKIEVNHRDEKQHLGVGDPQVSGSKL